MNDTIEKKLNDCLEKNDHASALIHCEVLEQQGDLSPQLKAVKGWCFYKLDDFDNAYHYLIEAFDQDPSNHYVATTTLSFFMEQARYLEVIALCQACVGLHAKDRLMWHRLATAHFLLGDIEGSIAAFRRSLQVEYSRMTDFGLSQPLLCQGKYEEGLRLYEHRFSAYDGLNWIQCEKMPMPQWRGESLKDKELLIWSEQGLGDSIQFTRIVTLLNEQGATVDMMLQKTHASLQELLQSIPGMRSVTVVNDNKVELNYRYDYHTPLMSLMNCIKLTPETIPVPDFPYISLPVGAKDEKRNPELDKLLKAANTKKLKVGIVWSTALTETFKQKDFMHFSLKGKKSLLPQEIEPLLQIKDIHFFSLHLLKSNAIQQVIDKHQIVDLSSCLHDFTDTAVAIADMDLVISVDTAVAHLAGAMNKPVINLLPFAADWRWQMHREDTPWYPTMRLMRQRWHGDWSGVVERLQDLLMRLIKEHNNAGKLTLFV
jgi:tetratricopeptide (TPR) repeat protein